MVDRLHEEPAPAGPSSVVVRFPENPHPAKWTVRVSLKLRLHEELEPLKLPLPLQEADAGSCNVPGGSHPHPYRSCNSGLHESIRDLLAGAGDRDPISWSESHGVEILCVGTLVTTDLTLPDSTPDSSAAVFSDSSAGSTTNESSKETESHCFFSFLCSFFIKLRSYRLHSISLQPKQKWQLSHIHSGWPSFLLHAAHMSWVSYDARKWVHASKVCNSRAIAPVGDSGMSLIFPATRTWPQQSER